MRALIVVTALLVLPASALADRAATKSEKTDIQAAVASAKQTSDFGCVKASNVRISTAGPWASTTIRACDNPGDAIFSVLKKVKGVWHIKSIGNGSVGCQAPKKVIKDLDLGC